MHTQLLSIIILSLIVIAIISVFIKIYNTIVMLKFNVEKSYANIDVLLKQRADEIPNLIKTVKEHIGYENELLTKLTHLRTQYLNTTEQNEKVDLQNKITSSFNGFMAIAENYPELKASQSFTALQSRVSQLEDHIADRREFFNESVNLYNISIHEFPNLILAKIANYTDKSLLTVTEVEKEYDGIKF